MNKDKTDPPSMDSVVEDMQDDDVTMGDIFNEWGKQKQEKKRSNLEWSTKKLRDLGVNFTSFNMGVHLKIDHNGYRADFWPSTGRFIFRNGLRPLNGVQKEGRGIKRLLRGIGLKK